MNKSSQVYMSKSPRPGAKQAAPTKDKVVPIRVTAEEHARIKAMARDDGRSATGFMRRMCLRGLSDYLQQLQSPAAH